MKEQRAKMKEQRAKMKEQREKPGESGLLGRTFDFAVRVIRFLKTIPYSKENDVIRYQLAKSATSVGANYEESQASSSKGDFYYKIGIVLREARESNYWLRILKATNISDGRELDALIQESVELKRIFGAIFAKDESKKIKVER
jgi:four helix bundle protein